MNVLLIDDDDVTNYINKRILKVIKPDANISIAVNGLDALEVIKQHKEKENPFFDMILVDISMPEMDGWAFIDTISKDEFNYLHNSSIFMLTSSVFDDDIAKARTKKIIKKFFSKPLDASKVDEMIALTNA